MVPSVLILPCTLFEPASFLCRSDSFCLRGIAERECAILPIRELAAYPRRSACEHLRSEERPSARRSLPAPVLLDDFRWQPDPVPWSGSLGRADSPCSGRTDSIYDSDSDHWKLRWKRTQNCRKAAQQPSVSLGFSCLRAFATSACEYVDSGAPGKESTQLRAKDQKSAQSGTRVTSNIVDSQVSGFKSAAAILQCRRQPNLGN